MKKGLKIGIGIGCAVLVLGAAGAAIALTNNPVKDYVYDNVRSDKYLGIEFGADGKATRLGAAEGLEAGINGEKNTFDTAPVYRKIQTYTSNGEKIWKTADFYFKHTVSGTVGSADFKERFYVCEKQLDDTWSLPDAFKNAKGENRGFFTLGCYKASLSEDGKKLFSKTGDYPATNISLEQSRVLAKANTATVSELRKVDVVDILAMIEFGKRDLKEIFKGVTSMADYDAAITEDVNDFSVKTNVVRYATADTIDTVMQTFIPGFGAKFTADGNYPQLAIRTIKDVKIVNYVKSSGTASSAASASSAATGVRCAEITFGGDPVDLKALSEKAAADGAFILNGTIMKNGLTDSLKGSSHELTSINGFDLKEGWRPFSYRGLENIWGVTYEWADGAVEVIQNSATVAKQKAVLATCLDPDLYDEGKTGATALPDYKDAYTLAEVGGNVGAFQSDNENASGYLVMGQKVNTGYYNSQNSIAGKAAVTDEKLNVYGIFTGSSYAGAGGALYRCNYVSADAVSDFGARLSFDIR
jgi:hypothetical protein